MIPSSSYKKGIAFSVVLNAMAKGLLFINLLAINYFVGANADTDIYFFCLTLITLIAGFGMYINTDAIVPELVRLKAQQKMEEAIAFMNGMLVWIVLTGLLVVIALWLFPFLSVSALSRFDTSSIDRNLSMISWFGLLFLLMVVVNFLSSSLTAFNYFSMPMLANLVNNVCAFVFLIVWGHRLSLHAAILGLVVGHVLNLIVLFFILYKQLRWSPQLYQIRINKRILQNIIWVLAAYLLYFGYMNVANYLLSGLNAGVLTAVNLGQQMAFAPYQLIISQILAIVAVKLFETNSSEDPLLLAVQYRRVLKFFLYYLVPASILGYLFSDDLVHLVLFFSHKTDVAYQQNAANVFGLLILGVPFNAIHVLNTKLLIARQQAKKMFFIHSIIYLFFFVLIWMGTKYFGLTGYLYGVLLANVFSVIFYISALKKDLYVLGKS